MVKWLSTWVTRMFNGERTVFSTNAKKTGYPHAKKMLNPYLIPHIKINWKWVKNLNLTVESIKILGENIGEKLHGIGFSKDFLDMKLKAQTTKERLDKLETIKIESFWAKDTISGLRKHPTEWEKMFVNHRFDKGLISRIYKEFLLQQQQSQTTKLINRQTLEWSFLWRYINGQ